MGIDRVLRRAVFLDRDGVINRPLVVEGRPYAPTSLDALELLPDVVAPLEALRRRGFVLVVVTNQPEIARGTLAPSVVEAMHARMAADLPIDDFRVCPHDDRDGCDCRKPRPGLLEAAARASRLDLASSYMIGDRWRDIEAGRRAGCRTVFIDHSYNERQPDAMDATVRSLREAVDWILSNDHGARHETC
jgi:D-glycero-D-manno-heptose 1,7-bisphosphate phosphatase